MASVITHFLKTLKLSGSGCKKNWTNEKKANENRKTKKEKKNSAVKPLYGNCLAGIALVIPDTIDDFKIMF